MSRSPGGRRPGGRPWGGRSGVVRARAIRGAESPASPAPRRLRRGSDRALSGWPLRTRWPVGRGCSHSAISIVWMTLTLVAGITSRGNRDHVDRPMIDHASYRDKAAQIIISTNRGSAALDDLERGPELCPRSRAVALGSSASPAFAQHRLAARVGNLSADGVCRRPICLL